MGRYCVHILATRHRELAAAVNCEDGFGAGLELGTPVLERAAGGGSALLPVSAAWLLAGTAPALYSRPARPPAPGALPSQAWLARLLCAVPSHWVPLYASNEHGLGANRFLHHTLAYRSAITTLPTLTCHLCNVVCIAPVPIPVAQSVMRES